MIDLSRKPKKEEKKDEPLGVIILGVMPFALLWGWMIIKGLFNV